MEDPRLRVMYWKLFLEKLDRSFSRRRRARTLWISAIAVFLVVLVGLVIADYEKGRGSYTRLKNTLVPSEHHEADFRPGGQEAVVLSRSALGDPTPEFLSVTLLPGRGMDVLQIAANLPGRGSVNLLASVDLAGAAGVKSGKAEDATGGASLSQGGPFFVPRAGRLGGEVGVERKDAAVVWPGRTFRLPFRGVKGEAPSAYGGLLLDTASSSVAGNPMPDGGEATATFASGDKNGRWPAETETRISVLLARRALEISVIVKNTGEEATPVGVGWAPRFVIPSGQREKATLRIPAAMREVMGQGNGAAPTGILDPVKGTDYDFNVPGGMALGSHGLDDTFVHLSAAHNAHPTIELRDPAARFGLRVTALSPTIKAVHVSSPANGEFVSISPQMNYDDPFSRRWPAGEDTGMVVLQPGQAVEWKVRVELFAVLPDLVRGNEPWWAGVGR